MTSNASGFGGQEVQNQVTTYAKDLVPGSSTAEIEGQERARGGAGSVRL